eukprot:763954-Hanusia_phi.AAC.2
MHGMQTSSRQSAPSPWIQAADLQSLSQFTPHVSVQLTIVLVGEGGRGPGPGPGVSRPVGVAAAEGVSPEQSDDLLVVEAHAVEDVAVPAQTRCREASSGVPDVPDGGRFRSLAARERRCEGPTNARTLSASGSLPSGGHH